MKRWGWLAAFSIAASADVSAAPPAAELSDPPSPTTELPALNLLNQIEAETPLVRRLEIIDQALAMLVQPTSLRGLVLCTRASVLEGLARYADARTAFEQCRQLRPNDPRVLLALAFDDVELKQPADAAQLVMRAASLSPDAVRQVPAASMEALLRLLRYSRAYGLAHRLTDVLVSTGWARENPSIFSSMTALVLRERLAEGRREEALTLLPAILSPQTGVGMLIDRRFATIWPEIERWAGPDLSVQRLALLEGARGAYEASHTADDFLAYVTALSDTGHRTQAIAELQHFRVEPPNDVDPFYRNMATVRLGHLLGETGRRGEGIALMRAALTGPDSTDRSVANVVPNLVIEMLLAKDYAGALAILDTHTPPEESVEAPAALGYFTALRACALRGAGRSAEADEALARVRAIYSTNADAVEIATDCAGSPEAQAALWIANAQDVELRTAALVEVAAARYRLKKGLPTDSIKSEAVARLAQRADVREVYDRFARQLPDAYGPASVHFEER